MIEPHDRHHRIPGWRQQALTEATVVIVGVGAIGNEVARLLAMAGVGRLILCDPDSVDVTNLSRTVLFRRRDADEKRLKVVAAADTLAELAPDTQVETRAAQLVHGVGLAELRNADLVVSCLDSRVARLQLAGRCGLVGAPWLDGGTSPWGGEIRPYLVTDGPCYGCTLGAAERTVIDAPWSCAEVREVDPEGSSVALSSVVGSWMGTLAIRSLMELPCPAQIVRLNGATGTSVLVEQERDPECPLHRRVGDVAPIPVPNDQTVAELLAALPRPGTVLSWAPIQAAIRCRSCGLRRETWGIPRAAACPECAGVVRSSTTLEVNQAPPSMLLSELGIAPREILAVRAEEGYAWIELAAPPRGHESHQPGPERGAQDA